MGRVRRYKKFKSCDPFAKKSNTKVDDKLYDEPVEIFEASVRKAEQRIQRRLENANSIEKMIQREAIRQGKIDEANQHSEKTKKMEGRREDESMKAFKNRIRAETRAALRNEVKKATSTAQKKKKYLEDKKFKKKGVTRFDVNEELVEEGFSSRHDGVLRQSDLGGRDDFATADEVRFGERMDKPPEFIGVAPLRLKKGDTYVEKAAPSNKKHNPVDKSSEALANKKASQAKAWADFNAKNSGRDTDGYGHDDDAGQEKDEEEQPARKKAKKSKISDIVGGDRADDSGDMSRMQGGITFAVANKGQKSSVSAKDLDKLRQQAQDAYRALRDKKRKF
jgi:hypothetical protein